MTPTLNWREIHHLVEQLRGELEGTFVDRFIVPERPRFAAGYLKGEWAIRLTSRRSEHALLFSIRARHPYLFAIPGKGPRAAPEGTRSPFDLAASKTLKGARLEKIEALPRERIIVLRFSAERQKLGLVLVLIPALPEAFLVRFPESADAPWPILARSRTIREGAAPGFYTAPAGDRAPPEVPLRHELVDSTEIFARTVEQELLTEAFDTRLRAAQKALRDALKLARERQRQSETAAQEASREADWQRQGDLLKAQLHAPPPLEALPGAKPSERFRRLVDWESGAEIRVACDPKLEPKAQVEKFYQLARRRQRRLEEATLRAQGFSEAAARLERALEAPPALPDWAALEKLERLGGTPVRAAGPADAKRPKHAGAWLGKTFISRDGFPILVGRSRDENLELTFRHARGNDVWLHVRGKPGAHAVIPLHSGKSAPLETLLDAANLVVYYSGGESWGKTEVDYTFKKYVKRIKDSTEASYTNNKTLLIEPDSARLKRLQQGQD